MKTTGDEHGPLIGSRRLDLDALSAGSYAARRCDEHYHCLPKPPTRSVLAQSS